MARLATATNPLILAFYVTVVFAMSFPSTVSAQTTTIMPSINSTIAQIVVAADEEPSGRTPVSDVIVGIMMMIMSLACGIAYTVILTTIWNDKDLLRMPSYKLMFSLGVFDVIQCFPHFVTGIFTIFQTVFHPFLAKAMGVIATPCYVAYAVLTIILSLNRLVQLWSPTVDKILFGDSRIYGWIALGSVFCIAFAIALSMPQATIRYIPEWYSWDYDFDLPDSHYVQRTEMYIEVGGIFVSAFFYVIIVILLVRTKKRFLLSQSYMTEVKVLIQATVITVYCTILNVLWHNYQVLLPANIWSYMALNFMWIFNSGIYPLIYFIVNKALRQRIKASKKISKIGGAVTVVFVKGQQQFSHARTTTAS